MKRTLASLAVLTALLTGCGAVSEATTAPATTPASIQEDDPGWDCWTMGNKTCGANPIERTEAWAKFDLDADKFAGDSGVKVTYRGLALTGLDFPPSNTVTIPSDVTPGKVHVFTVGG